MKTNIPSIKSAIKTALSGYSLRANPTVIADIEKLVVAVVAQGSTPDLQSIISTYLTMVRLQEYDLGISREFHKPEPVVSNPRRAKASGRKVTKRLAVKKPVKRAQSATKNRSKTRF